jgi:hypothetical protein
MVPRYLALVDRFRSRRSAAPSLPMHDAPVHA